jgi:rubrerythrin
MAVEGSPVARAELTGEESLEQILAKAVELERAAVRLYEDLRMILPPDADHDILDRLIAEEQDHADALADKLHDAD